MKITKRCPFCGKETTIDVEARRYKRFEAGVNVQQAFPNMHVFHRELLISGMCENCYEKIYNTPAPGHEELFGERLGSCECCGMAVYEKDVKDGEFRCKCCGSEAYE